MNARFAKTVLLIEPGRIGDWLVSQAIVRGSKLFEQGHVDWVVREEVLPLLKMDPAWTGRVFALAGRPSVQNILGLVLRLWRTGGRYGELAVLGHGRSAELIARLGWAQKKYGCLSMAGQSGRDRQGRAFVYDSTRDHISMRAIRALGLSVAGLAYQDLRQQDSCEATLGVDDESQQRAAHLLVACRKPPASSAIALHVGASWPGKRWPVACWVELANRLAGRSFDLLFIAGPGEEPLAHEIIEQIAGRMHCQVICQQPLSVVGALLRRMAAFIGCDSGIMHLAASVNCPTVALFGASDAAICAPLKPSSRLVAVEADAHCPARPCFRPSMDPRALICVQPAAPCMAHLPVAAVLQALQQLGVDA